MNLKLTNEMRSSVNLIGAEKKPTHSIKEERRRTGRYIAVLVGISLFMLAIYHAWVRRIPIVASLVVPALIMFVYVGWVLYTASRDKHKLLDAEAALHAAQEAEMEVFETQNNLEISIISSKDTSKTTSPVSTHKEWVQISSALIKEVSKEETPGVFITPVILVNDRSLDSPEKSINEDLDHKWSKLVESVLGGEKLRGVQTKRKFKRRFCRSKRYAAFKRSYSIA